MPGDLPKGYKGMAQTMEGDIPFFLGLFVNTDTSQFLHKSRTEIFGAYDLIGLAYPAFDNEIGRSCIAGKAPDHLQNRLHIRRQWDRVAVFDRSSPSILGGLEAVVIDIVVLDCDDPVLYISPLEPPDFTLAHTAPGGKQGEGVSCRQGYQLL
jgi:hypothetical protein